MLEQAIDHGPARVLGMTSSRPLGGGWTTWRCCALPRRNRRGGRDPRRHRVTPPAVRRRRPRSSRTANAGDGPGHRIVGSWPRTRTPRDSRLNHATLRPASTAAWPRASRNIVLPVPDGPRTSRFSRLPTHSRMRSAAGWERESTTGLGPRRQRSCRSATPLPPGGLQPRTGSAWPPPRRAVFAAFRPAPALRPGGGQHLGSGPAVVGQAHAPQERLELSVQRRGLGSPLRWWPWLR